MFDFLDKIIYNIKNTSAESWWVLAGMMLTWLVFFILGLRDYYKNREYYDNLPEEERKKWMHYPPGL